MSTVIKLYNAENVNMEPAYTIKDNQVIGTGFVEYSISGNTVYKGPFAGGMAVATFDDEQLASLLALAKHGLAGLFAEQQRISLMRNA